MLISKKPFLSELANFSVSDRLGRNFPTLQNGLKKRKNLYLIKLVSKWKRANRKGHTSFFGFDFWDLKNGAFRFSITFCNRKSKSFFSKMWGWYQEKQPNLKIWVKIFLKRPSWPTATKLETKLLVFSTGDNWWLKDRIC